MRLGLCSPSVPDRFGIETKFEAITFRSRLEARWAHFFESLGWNWTYEPFDTDFYIPDFMIGGPAPLLVEIKPEALPTVELEAALTKSVEKATEKGWQHEVCALGADPMMFPEAQVFDGREFPAAGLLAERHESGTPAIDRCVWIRCGSCGDHALIHQTMSWRSRPCGHYDGDRYVEEPDVEELVRLWRLTADPTRWTR